MIKILQQYKSRLQAYKTRIFPFLLWGSISPVVLRVDLFAGITGALVLVPKAMAYAQLSGLPVYYGLYAAFIPTIIGALWGSSRQLLTGPVAVISLMTASALLPLAVAGSDEYIVLAFLLALLVGVIQLSMGLFKLGMIVNFISHPVIVGFINAAAIIIGMSQFNKLLGIPLGRSDSFLYDLWEMLRLIGDTHLPTLGMGLLALAIMVAMKKYTPEAIGRTNVLVAVAIATLLSAAVGFEQNRTITLEQVADHGVREKLTAIMRLNASLKEGNGVMAGKSHQFREAQKADASIDTLLTLEYEIKKLKNELITMESRFKQNLNEAREFNFEFVSTADKDLGIAFLAGQVPQGVRHDGHVYYVKKVENGKIKLVGGGEVVGDIPPGLPGFKLPHISWDGIVQLLSAAFVIAMVAFMEAISMAKAMATKTKQRLDANQELIGQGLANITGSCFQSYPVTGSFSGSAINLQAGATTGIASVINGLFVGITLLLLTTYLYHLPQAVLSVIIIMAVTSLIHFSAIKRAWIANRNDGIVAIVTFVMTLAFAPHLEEGVLVGAGLALGLYLYRTMQPRVAILARHADGTLRDAQVFNLKLCDDISMIRFDGSLYFANTAHFEDKVMERVALKPELKFVIVVGDGINQIDASGEEMLMHLTQRLHDSGVEMLFTGLKKQVMDVIQNTGFHDEVGAHHFYRTVEQALDYVWRQLGNDHEVDCPLNVVCQIDAHK